MVLTKETMNMNDYNTQTPIAINEDGKVITVGEEEYEVLQDEDCALPIAAYAEIGWRLREWDRVKNFVDNWHTYDDGDFLALHRADLSQDIRMLLDGSIEPAPAHQALPDFCGMTVVYRPKSNDFLLDDAEYDYDEFRDFVWHTPPHFPGTKAAVAWFKEREATP
jgi:PHD/YefM family antitoxin component YafN of YafNO toxin-antitoxin module